MEWRERLTTFGSPSDATFLSHLQFCKRGKTACQTINCCFIIVGLNNQFYFFFFSIRKKNLKLWTYSWKQKEHLFHIVYYLFFKHTKELRLAQWEVIALINHPSKWILLKLTIPLGHVSNDRRAGNRGSGPKNQGVNESGDSVYPGYLQFEAEEDLSGKQKMWNLH